MKTDEMKILVTAAAPGTVQEVVKCTSDADFLVYGVTNSGGDYAIDVQSTGVGIGLASPTFTVGGIAKDVVQIIFQPGTTAFLTLQTEKNANASISAT